MTTLQPCDHGVVLSAPESVPCAKIDQKWVLVATILGSSMAFIDGTVVNVALPALQRELGARSRRAVGDGGVRAVSLRVAARRRRARAIASAGAVSTAGTAIVRFAFASAAGWLVTSDPLIAARARKGSALRCSCRAASPSSVPRSRNASAGAPSARGPASARITAAIGPVLGGWMIEHLSWRWAFFMNLPLAAIVIACCSATCPKVATPGEARLDLLGALLATDGLGGLVYGLIESSRLGWSIPPVICRARVGS